MPYALIASEWLNIGAAMLLFGASAMGEVLRGEAYGWGARPEALLRRLLRLAAAVALLGAIAWLPLEAASMSGSWQGAASPTVIRAVLEDTEFGHLWIGRLTVAAAVCVIAWRGRCASRALALAGAVLLASLALTGHAVMQGGWLGLGHRLNQGVHLLAAGLWLGGLAPLALLLAGAARRPANRRPIIRALRRFSDVAIAAVLLILGSGIVNAAMLVGGFPALTASAYGRTLLLKLALVAALVTLAIANRFVLLPLLAAEGGAALARLERNVKIEIALGAVVIAVAVVLGNLPPPGM